MPPHALSAIPSGTAVFIDANVFCYALTNRSMECQTILRRCIAEDLLGVTSLHVINEATHRLMLAEAEHAGIITRAHASLMKKKLDSIMRLRDYWGQTEHILSMNLLFLTQEVDSLRVAQSVRAAHGLLTNDSLIVAGMRKYGLSALASADKDFDRVSGLCRYAPSDIA